MALAPGTRIGPYEVVSLLGEGGMGAVYRARDTRLDRDVALKVLPPLFTDDADRLARFDREARVLASLNHPNIAHVYGLEHGDGDVRAIAMELVDGDDLSLLIKKRHESQPSTPDLVGWALPIARQIAAALESAHDNGIVHRDLKPANVKVRDDGTVKVLDFGLAKALDPVTESSRSDAMNSPTLTARATQLGMILGTAAYMAPEQAKGRAVDRRADVWAFGAVLYEMLSGRRAFDGDDVPEVMAAVLKLDPDWSALPADLPAPVRRLLRRCLEKDPKKRLRDVGEGMIQLDEGLSDAATVAGDARMSGATAPATAPSHAAPRPLWRGAAPVAAGVVLLALGALAGSAWMTRDAAPDSAVVRFNHVIPPTSRIAVTPQYGDIALTPDAKAVVYTGVVENQPTLFVRRLDALDASPLRGGESGYGPFVSPDGAWVGYHDGTDFSRLKKVSIFGGPPVVLVKADRFVMGATWTDDGQIVFGGGATGLRMVPDGGGGTPVEITTLDRSRGEDGHGLPHAVPGSQVVLFTTIRDFGSTGIESAQLAAVDRSDGRVVRFDLAGSYPRYLASGHLVFVAADGSMRAVRFDPVKLELTGNPVPVLDGVAVKATGAANFDLTADGHAAYVPGGAYRRIARSIVWVDRTGVETPVAAPERTYFYAHQSPIDARIALDVRDDQQDVWIWDPRGTLTRLTVGEGADEYGIWTPDGRHVVSYSRDSEGEGIFLSRTDVTGARDVLLRRPASYPNAVTPDGKAVIFRSATGDTKGSNDLFVVSLSGDRTARTLIGTEHDEYNATISPDGRWIAYQSNLSSRMEIYVSPYPGVSSRQVTVSTAGGIKPLWSHSGRELYYLAPDNRLMAVPLTASPDFTPGTPVPLFDASKYFFGGLGRNYDLSRDGTRFLMVKNPPEGAGTSMFTVVLNWASEIRDRIK